MARILPEQPMGQVSPAMMRIHRLIEALPERYFAWAPLQATADHSDFWVVEESTRRSVHLCVSEVTEDQARGPGLFEPQTWIAPADQETPRLQRLEAVLIAGPARAIVFPHVPGELLPRQIGLWERGGREICRPQLFPDWIASRLGQPVDPTDLRTLRAQFCPETVLLASQTMRRDPSESPVPQFLTWKQEEILKTDLDPGAEGRQIVGDFGLLVVQGVAGSGKSLILLHRAWLLSRLRPSRILVLTCNKPLQVELRRRYRELGGVGVDFQTFHGFCLKCWGRDRPRIIEPARRRLLLDEVLATLERPLLLRKQLEEELAWIYDHGFADEAAYIQVPRRGRGFRMDVELRSRLWAASVKFREACALEKVADWSLLPWLFSQSLEGLEVGRYDAILVDEAQFFAPVWFQSVRRFLAPRGHLFLAADPTQGFLRRGASWKSVGLAVQGKSRRLERSHRSTRPIMELAWKVWGARADPAEADILVPQLEGMPTGPAPVWYCFPDRRREHDWIQNQVEAYLASGGRPRDVLVLHDDWSGSSDLRERLTDRLGAEHVTEARDGSKPLALRVCSLHSATGLEASVVFVAGAQGIFEREGSPDLDAEGRAQARDEATRKFYMALTRAGWRLVVTSVGALPAAVGECFGTQTP